MALFTRWTGGEVPTATKWNETSIPVVSSTADISAPYTGQIVFNTTNKKAYRYSGSAWVVLVGGPTWHLIDGAGQAMTTGVYTDVAWDTEVNDSDNQHSGSSINVVISVPGYYLVSTCLAFVNNNTGTMRAAVIYQNGVVVPGSNVVLGPVTGWPTSVVVPSVGIQCAAGDTLKVGGRHDRGSTLNLQATYSMFTGSWLHD